MIGPKTHIKICGITRLDDARYCAAAGADYLGFIQFASSPRFVDPSAARDIIQWVHGPQTVGVFVNASADEVNRTADEAGFDLVQLHGSESPDLCRTIERPVIKALHVRENMGAADIGDLVDLYIDAVTFLLLDTYHPDLPGGTGASFRHEIAAAAARAGNVFVAGGLDALNVAEVVQQLHPYAIDVAGGVESSPGTKDFEKVDAFFAAIDAATD